MEPDLKNLVLGINLKVEGYIALNSFLRCPTILETTTEELFLLENGVYGGQQFPRSTNFNDVARYSQAKKLLRHSGIGFLTQDKYFGVWDEFADSSSRFDSIQFGKTDIEQNQVRFQFLRFLDGF